MTREEWLLKAVDLLRPEFKAISDVGLCTPIPKIVRVSVGFPSSKGLSMKKRAIGECWHAQMCPDKVPHIFISPLLSAALDDEDGGALVTLVRELCHAVAPFGAKHGAKFVRVWKLAGFEGKPTNDHAGETLKKLLREIAKELGPYPHKALVAPIKLKKEACRQLKMTCECERIIRVTRKVIEEGPINCGNCGGEFEEAA